MPFYEFSARVDGGLYARDEKEARATIELELGKLGSVDIEELSCEEDEDDQENDH